MKSVVPTGGYESLTQSLHRHLAGYQEGRSKVPIHASDVTNQNREFCAREIVLYHVIKAKPADEFVTTSQNVTWGIGRDVESKMAHWFADLGMAVGDWKCLICSSLHKLQKRPTVCPTHNCNSKLFKHIEVRATDPVSGISCGLDVLVRRKGDLKLTIVECKTIKSDKFKDLVAPLAEHRARTRIYMHCAAADDNLKHLVRPEVSSVIYVAKSGWGVFTPSNSKFSFKDGKYSPFREFEVTQDYTEIDEYLLSSKVAWDRIKDPSLPIPSRICPTSFCKRAGECGVSGPCFTMTD